MDFSKTLIRCSALGSLFTEPRSKADKDAGNLSETAKTYLNKVYVEEIWGASRDITSKYTEKGKLCEEEAIGMLSEEYGYPFQKNEERRSNEYLTGECDLVGDDTVWDVKCSWDAESFICNLTSPPNKDYIYQLQGYMCLWNAKQAYIKYCLVSMPNKMLLDEKYKLLRQMDVATEESPVFQEAWMKLLGTLVFDWIPVKHRIISIPVPRDESIISLIPNKVQKAREYLQQLYELHYKPQTITV